MSLGHIFDNKGPRGLKDNAIVQLGMLDGDEEELDNAVKHCIAYAKQHGWDIARKGHPHFGNDKKNLHKADFWLPKAYALANRLPLKHRYHTLCRIYAIKDAVRTAGLFILQQKSLVQNPSFVKPYNIQRDALLPFTQMERTGLHLIPEAFDVQRDKYTLEKAQLKVELYKKIKASTTLGQRVAIHRKYKWNINVTPFNPESQKHLQAIIFDVYKFKGLKKTQTGWSTDKESLQYISSQENTKPALDFVDSLANLKSVISTLKYLTTYQNAQLNRYIYPSIHICGTSTTRVSSSDPNGQNVGKGKDTEDYDEDGNKIVKHSLRAVFGPPKGKHWLAIDYDQLQIRIFAYWSQEPQLIKAIEQGFDFHNYVAQLIFETEDITKLQRRIAKNVNFGILFGAGSKKINRTCGMPGVYERVLELFPNVAETLARTIAQVKQYGYVTTASGYRLYVNKSLAYAGVCYYVQGTEGDIVKKAVADTYKIVRPTTTQLMFQIHDELLFQFPKYKQPPVQQLVNVMQDAGHYFGVPCICKPELITTSWDKPKTWS